MSKEQSPSTPCPACGKPVADGDRFCRACGAAAGASRSAPEATPATPPETPRKSGGTGRRKSGVGCLVILFVIIAGAAFGFRHFIADFVKDVRTDHGKDSRETNNLDKAVARATFQKILDYIDANVPEIKQQQGLYHEKKKTGIKVIYNVQGVELPPVSAPDYALMRDYHWVYVNFWHHKGVFDDKQLWSWTFLVKKDFSELLAYDAEKDSFRKAREWQTDIERIRKYMALADK